jgi:hypothetical protein
VNRFKPQWDQRGVQGNAWLPVAIKELACFFYCTSKSRDLEATFGEMDKVRLKLFLSS